MTGTRALDTWPFPKPRPLPMRQRPPTEEQVAELRSRLRARITCPHCGTSRLSYREAARQARVPYVTLFQFLQGDRAPRLATYNRLAAWLGR